MSDTRHPSNHSPLHKLQEELREAREMLKRDPSYEDDVKELEDRLAKYKERNNG